MAPGHRALSFADFNQDGHSDIVLQSDEGRLSLWLMQETNRLSVFTLRNGISAAPWRVFSATELGGNGRRDILFNHPDGRMAVWSFDQTNFVSGVILRGGRPLAAGWHGIGTSDFDGDLQPDILLRHASGRLAIARMNAGEYICTELVRSGLVPPPNWRVVSTGDFNEDGQPDILWRNTDNQLAIWIMNGQEFVRSMFLRNGLPIGSHWRVAGPR